MGQEGADRGGYRLGGEQARADAIHDLAGVRPLRQLGGKAERGAQSRISDGGPDRRDDPTGSSGLPAG